MVEWFTATGAALERWYPDFRPEPTPAHTGAVRAFRGVLRPFSESSELSAIIWHLENAGSVLNVGPAGLLLHARSCSDNHTPPPYLHRLTAMEQSYEVVLVDFGPKKNPRVYATRPEISRRLYPFHPHLRDDQLALIDGKPLPALCVYLASDEVLVRDEMALVHVLDFTAMFLAEQAVWQRATQVRRTYVDPHRIRCSVEEVGYPDLLPFLGVLPQMCFDGIHPLYAAHFRRDAAVRDDTKLLTEHLVRGGVEVLRHWPGEAAPHFTDQLLREVRPSAECPCGSGKAYSDCCRAQHYSESLGARERRAE